MRLFQSGWASRLVPLVASAPRAAFAARSAPSGRAAAPPVPDVAALLARIRRGCEQHASKLPATLDALLQMDGPAIEAAGVPCRPRKMILAWTEKYR